MNSTGYPALDGYLSRVGLRLTMMEGRHRREILEELEGHILDRATHEGDGEATVTTVNEAVSEAKHPAEVARQFRDLYGWGTPFRALALAAGAGAAVLSVPPVVEGMWWVAPTASFVYLVFLLFVSLGAGARTGLVVAGVGSIVRLLGLASLDTALYEGLELQLFVSTYLMVTLFGLLLACFPGYLKRRFLRDFGYL